VIRPSDLERFISDFEDRLAPVERAADEAWWNRGRPNDAVMPASLRWPF